MLKFSDQLLHDLDLELIPQFAKQRSYLVLVKFDQSNFKLLLCLLMRRLCIDLSHARCHRFISGDWALSFESVQIDRKLARSLRCAEFRRIRVVTDRSAPTFND